jgi:hypothetical protein
MPIVDGQYQIDPTEFAHPWTGGHGKVDYRARPGRRTDLPEGVFASCLPNGRQTSSCVECQDLLRSFASAKAAKDAGLVCGMYRAEWPSYCLEQAKVVRR